LIGKKRKEGSHLHRWKGGDNRAFQVGGKDSTLMEEEKKRGEFRFSIREERETQSKRDGPEDQGGGRERIRGDVPYLH